MNPYIRLPKVPIVQGRQDTLLARCTGKRVLHLGCVDAGLLQERFSRHELMHQKLALVTDDLWGVDVDADGIAFLQSKGTDKLIVGDICRASTFSPLRGIAFDVILASEVMEHLENPGLFLDAVAMLMTRDTEFIVTVPNAFRVDTLLQLFHSIEYVHPDHNYWFSYHSLTTLLRKKGYQVTELCVYSFQPLRLFGVKPGRLRQELAQMNRGDVSTAISRSSIGRRGRLRRYLRSLPKRILVAFLYRLTPFWGDGVIAVAHRHED